MAPKKCAPKKVAPSKNEKEEKVVEEVKEEAPARKTRAAAKPKEEPKPKEEKQPKKKAKKEEKVEEVAEEKKEEEDDIPVEYEDDVDEAIRLVDLEQYKTQIDELDDIADQVDVIEEELEEKIADLEYEFESKRAPLYAKRAETIKKIPDFWAQAIVNSSFFTWCAASEDALELLKLIESIEVTYPSKTETTVKFCFKTNDFFAAKEVTRKYFIKADEEEMEDYAVETSSFDWKKKPNFEAMKKDLMNCECKEPTSRKRAKASECGDGCECINCVCKGECNCHELIHPFEWIEESNIADIESDMIATVFLDRIYPQALEYFMGYADDDESDLDESDMFSEEEGDE